MKNFNVVFIFIAIIFFRFEFSTKDFTKHARQINVKIFVHTNIIIFLTTLFKTETLKFFSLIDRFIFKTSLISKNFATHSLKLDSNTKISSIVIFSSSASVNYKPIIKVLYTMTSTSSLSQLLFWSRTVVLLRIFFATQQHSLILFHHRN